MDTDQDKQIAMLENYVLAASKEAFIKTLVPNSDSHMLVMTMHELNARGSMIGDEAAEYIAKWKAGSVSVEQKKLVLRQLLLSIDAQTLPANIKTEIQNIDKLTDQRLNELKGYNKPVIFAAGEEFKEDSENKMSTELSSNACPDIYLAELIKKVNERPEFLKNSANETFLYQIDLEKAAKTNPEAIEQVLSSRTNFANLKVRYILFRT
jgi:hypothetical protein